MKATLETPLDEALQNNGLLTVGDILEHLNSLSQDVKEAKNQSLKLAEQLSGLLELAKINQKSHRRINTAYTALFDSGALLANTLLELSDKNSQISSSEVVQAVKLFVTSMSQANAIASRSDDE